VTVLVFKDILGLLKHFPFQIKNAFQKRMFVLYSNEGSLGKSEIQNSANVTTD